MDKEEYKRNPGYLKDYESALEAKGIVFQEENFDISEVE